MTSLAIGDVDGDDDLDLALVNHNDSVSVSLGNGDGTFAAPTAFAVDDGPFWPARAHRPPSPIP